MELTLRTFLIVCPLVFLGGFMDSIAGGGGLISLPAYLIAGVPIHFALGTNKISASSGGAIAAFRYYKNKYVDLLICLPCIFASLIGSSLGANLTLLLNEKYLQYILLIVIPVTAFYVFKKKNLDTEANPLPRRLTIILAIIISFFLGAYDGFFGPGTGTFLILLYTGLVKMDSRIALGNSKLVNLTSNLSSAVIFFINGRVILPLGICAAIFSITGSYVGSGLVISRGTRLIRYMIMVVLALLFGKVAFDIIKGI